MFYYTGTSPLLHWYIYVYPLHLNAISKNKKGCFRGNSLLLIFP
ncbi:hypothetical protein CHK_1112 [Christensenella hongkongensis]|uniref:Uncharacterized protein n=1 Tax=Christensenella hongkongensis TaxID=270498 RepID=A0A0M2NFL7_9FIRM|nr:hypothetical protein CHK_1112 [Christensenella hongkongensis]